MQYPHVRSWKKSCRALNVKEPIYLTIQEVILVGTKRPNCSWRCNTG